MKKLSLILFLGLALNAQVLKQSKQQELENEQQKSALEADLLRDSWIAPLNITGDITKSKNNNSKEKTRKASINLDQDIFRSGGIYYMIQKATLQKKHSQ